MLKVDDSWQNVINDSLNNLDKNYLEFLYTNKGYFPNKNYFLNAFKTLPLSKTKYILFGQDPYPRINSASGYAFIDNAVKNIWNKTNGFSKNVNKATSLRNFLKMLLICDGKLDIQNTSKKDIMRIDTSNYIQNIEQLKNNFEKNGVLLLNMALIFTTKNRSNFHIKNFQPFINNLLLSIKNHNIKLILFGNIAKGIQKLYISKEYQKYLFEHPYNNSFIASLEVHNLFSKMKLLDK
jgi:uracil-DNA glycosylase